MSQTKEKTKHPSESFDVGFFYLDPETTPEAGDTISGVTIQAFELTNGTEDNTVLASTTGVVAAGGLSYEGTVQAGTDGEDYRIEFTVTWTAGDVFVDVVLLHVRVKPTS